MNNKLTGWFSGLIGLALFTFIGIGLVSQNYEWSNNYSSYWSLSTKASTIEQKSQYMDTFVSALQASGLQGSNDAFFLKTPDNSFDQNFVALQSLQSRLHDIKTMDVSSLQYQQAISQITSQEQDGGDAMISVFHECWLKVHYYWLWNQFIFIPLILFMGICFFFSIVMFS